jgi:hypothetical protein
MISRMLGTRPALLTLAIAVCGWFALGVNAVNKQKAVNWLLHHVSGPLTPAQEAHAMHELDSAGVANPDGELDILRAQVLLDAGDNIGARRVLRHLLTREPQNVSGWVFLSFTRPPRNPDSLLASARIRQLAPFKPHAP